MRTGFYTGNYDHAAAALPYIRECLEAFEKTLADVTTPSLFRWVSARAGRWVAQLVQ